MPFFIKFFKSRDQDIVDPQVEKDEDLAQNSINSINDFNFNYTNPNYQKE